MMSKVTVGIFLSAVVLLLLAAVFQLQMVAGGGALLMLVAIIYAFVVTKRDIERSAYIDVKGS